jgi:CSLREA domain-containing protein
MIRRLLLTLAALLAIAAPAQADSVVDTHADIVSADGKCSLREAVERNPDCGTGTIRVPGGGGPYLLTGTLVFADGTAPTRVEGTGAVLQATGAPHRVVVVSSNRTVFLSGLTIKGGVATGPTLAGGGIHNLGNLTLERVVVTGNTVAPAPPGANGGATGGAGSVGGNGAGIYNAFGSTLTLDRTTVSGNTAGTGGAGGFGDPSSPTSPAGGRGGGGGTGGSGGGIFNVGTATLTDSTVTGNSAGAGGSGAPGLVGWDGAGGQGGTGGRGGVGGDGGGIANTGTLTIVRSTIAGNRAGRGGDGASAGDGGVGGTVNKDGGPGGFGGSAGNAGQGGGVHTTIGVTTVTNSTIANNAGGAGGNGSAGGNGGQPGVGGAVGVPGVGGEGGDGGYGGGLLAGNTAAATLTLTHATIAGNKVGARGAGGPPGSGLPGPVGDPGGLGFGPGVYVNLATVSARNSIFGGNACVGELDDLGGNTSSPGTDCLGLPRDPLLGPLANNGGPTQTMGLRAGSPAIGLVSSNCATTDQRGVRRPVGGRCDAGAFEGTLTTPGAGAKPSLGSPKAKFKKRRLTLTYAVSGPGTLAVRVLMKAKRVGRRTVHPTAAGNVKVRVKLAKKAIKALKAHGRLRLRTRAVFTPTGGTPITKTKRVTLRKR